MALRIAGLGTVALGSELRPFRPPRRAGQQAFHGLEAGAVFLDRPLWAFSPRRTDLR